MIKPNIRFRYLSAGRVLLTHTRNLEVITLPRENHIDVICLPSHISHKMQPLDKAHMELLKTFYRQWIEKWLRSHPGRVVTVYQIDELFGNAYKRAATGEIAAKGFRATGLFPCDKNIFRPHDFPLAPEDTQADPVSHLALVKTSDQPSFSSANFSPFTSAQALRSSDIRALPSLNLKPNPRSGSAKKRTSPHKLILWAILLWWRPAIRHNSVLLVFAVPLCWGSPSIRYQPCAKPEPTAK